jgi:multidrug resistance efflux pump
VQDVSQQSYQKIVDIATAETNQAQSQLTAAQSRLAREQQLVKSGSVDRSAKTSYQLAQLGNRAKVQGIVTITAPIDGTIADREITIGQSVADPGVKLISKCQNLVGSNCAKQSATIDDKIISR